jgi:hypothetical protein
MSNQSESRSIDFTVFGEPLIKLLTALGNKLSRGWPILSPLVLAKSNLKVTDCRDSLPLHDELSFPHWHFRAAG